MSFCYNIDEMPRELNLVLLAYGKIGLVIPRFQEPINDIKWELTVHGRTVGEQGIFLHNRVAMRTSQFPNPESDIDHWSTDF